MKRGLKWSFLIIGTTIGAGYASGREVWFFFGENNGRAILVFTVLFAMCCYSILSYSYQQQTTQYKPVLNKLFGKKVSGFYDIMMMVYLIVTTIIMIAGSGVTFQVYQVPTWIGALFTGLMLIWAFSYKVDQVLNINTIIVPVLLLSLFSIIIFTLYKEPNLEYERMIQPNYFKAITFTGANLLPIISIFGAVGKKIKTKKEIIVATIISPAILGVLTWLYSHSLIRVASEIDTFEMPIYAILVRFPTWALLTATLVLWIAIYTTAIGSMLGLISRIQTWIKLNQFKIAILVVTICFPISFLGFQALVEVIYPIYGVLNIYLLIRLIISPILNKMNKV